MIFIVARDIGNQAHMQHGLTSRIKHFAGGSLGCIANVYNTTSGVYYTSYTKYNCFFTAGGSLGCIANVHNTTSGVYYISLYNLDTSPATQFVCIVSISMIVSCIQT